MISHVLDTCAVLDLAVGRWTDKVARRELASALDPVILSVSVWEIARKLRLGKLRLPCEPGGVLSFMEELCERHQLRIVPLSAETCEDAECLPANHEDSFDRMIIALAVRGSCPVFTTDKRFSAYPVVVFPQR